MHVIMYFHQGTVEFTEYSSDRVLHPVTLSQYRFNASGKLLYTIPVLYIIIILRLNFYHEFFCACSNVHYTAVIFPECTICPICSRCLGNKSFWSC